MNDKQREILVITQEECAEVIQEISKIFRFGIEEKHKDGMLHKEKLEMEVGDLLTMIDLLIEFNLVDKDSIEINKNKKIEKLKIYSSIFKK
jgi:NTP pyrophosphatase (non-canonical NTP hydrolase)